MQIDIQKEINKDQLRERLLPFTRKAFHLLPQIEHPSILDIGCGSGIPTIELALLSSGRVTGIDTDREAIAKLKERIEGAGLSDWVNAFVCSMTDIDFPDQSFDIIWAEGSIFAVGFQKGLKDWKRLLKDRGFLVVHDELKSKDEKLVCIPDCGYTLLGTFTLSADVWWTEYFSPLEKRVEVLRSRLRHDPGWLKVLDKEQREIDMCKNQPECCSSIYYIMQKRDGSASH